MITKSEALIVKLPDVKISTRKSSEWPGMTVEKVSDTTSKSTPPKTSSVDAAEMEFVMSMLLIPVITPLVVKFRIVEVGWFGIGFAD